MNLSIIIPVYNCVSLLESCLQSIVPNITDAEEVIIVDDGSTTDISSICKRYKKSNIYVLRKENGGVSSARNFGLANAKGKFVMFVDADDKLKDNWHGEVCQYYNSHEDIIVFSSSNDNIHLSKEKIITTIFQIPGKIQMKYLATVWSKLYRRDFLLKNNISFIHGLINGEDALFTLEAMLCSNNYLFVNTSIYYYHINPISETHKYKDGILETNINFISYSDAILSRYSVPQAIKDECLKYSFINGLILFVQRLSYIDKKEAKLKLSFLNDPHIIYLQSKFKLLFMQYGVPRYFLYTLISRGYSKIALMLLRNLTRNTNYLKEQYILV